MPGGAARSGRCVPHSVAEDLVRPIRKYADTLVTALELDDDFAVALFTALGLAEAAAEATRGIEPREDIRSASPARTTALLPRTSPSRTIEMATK